MKAFLLKTEQQALDRNYVLEGKAPAWKTTLKLDEPNLMCLVASLQLAMRHPEFASRPTGRWCARFIDTLIETIPKDRPALRRLMEAGNNFAFDELPAKKTR